MNIITCVICSDSSRNLKVMGSLLYYYKEIANYSSLKKSILLSTLRVAKKMVYTERPRPPPSARTIAFIGKNDIK